MQHRMQNKPLAIALVLSLVVHSLFLVVLPGIGFDFGRSPQTRVDVVYSPYQQPPVEQASRLSSSDVEQMSHLLMERKSLPVEQTPSHITKVKQAPRPLSDAGQTSRPVAQKSHPVEQASSHITKTGQASRPPSRMSHLSTPFVPTSVKEGIAYMNYFEALRDKIQESVRYPKEWSPGEVYVSFIIKSDGSLKLDAINILDKNSTSNRLLRDAAIQTIIASAPFPPFPKGLDRKEICFNIPIVYKSGNSN